MPNGEVDGNWGEQRCLQMMEFCFGRSICEPTSPRLNAGAGFSGFYPEGFEVLEPLGARIIGIGVNDAFGTSVALSNQLDRDGDPGDIIISSPNRTARGIRCCQDSIGTETGPEITGLDIGIRSDSGVAYLFPLRNLWEPDAQGRVPPRPFQYMVGQPSHCDSVYDRIPNVDAIRIAGAHGDQITNIIGINDFNQDGRNDFAIGAPRAGGGLGRLYIGFRRARQIEDDYVLEKLARDPRDPGRLAGVLVVADSTDAFGASLASGVDFDGDGIGDLIVGSPDANGGVGEVIVIFSDSNLVSPRDGITVAQLLATGRAARITGNPLDPDGHFGFNLANAGDVNGDGVDDLMVAAPGATPRFDPNPTDSVDELIVPGLDLDFDGRQDDIADLLDLPGFDNDMKNAGLVYVILGAHGGSNRLDVLGGDNTVSVAALGSKMLSGFMVAGRRAGDYLGGGDAGETRIGGIAAKTGCGRSYGLSAAGDVDGDHAGDILIGSVLSDPRRDRSTGVGTQNGGEVYLIYGGSLPPM